MAAPTRSNGLSRAVEFALPAAGVFVGLAIVGQLYGELVAGLLYIGITMLILTSLHEKMTYWNTDYMGSFVLAGIVLWFVVPGVLSHLVHTGMAEIGQLLVLVFFVIQLIRFAEKSGLEA